jgi:hypothetical protein
MTWRKSGTRLSDSMEKARDYSGKNGWRFSFCRQDRYFAAPEGKPREQFERE